MAYMKWGFLVGLIGLGTFVPALAGNLTVAARGAAPTYAVVIPAKASPVERYAAAEFVRTVARQTGVSLQIRNDDASVPTKAVFIGSTRHDGLLSEAESELASLGDDGFRLVAKPPHLFVGTEWLWHDVGEWVPSPGDYVSFLRAHGEGEALVDSIEIVRVGK